MTSFFIVILLLCIPIRIFSIGGVEVPPSAILFPFSVCALLFTPRKKVHTILIISITLAFLSVLFTSFIDSNNLPRQLQSWFYFFFSCLTFFLGYSYIKRLQEIKLAVKIMAFTFSIIAILIVSSLVLHGSPVRSLSIFLISGSDVEGSFLNGSILGLPLYASYGVNSLAVFYSIMLMFIIIYRFSNTTEHRRNHLLLDIGIVCDVYLILGSLSREAILGSLFFILLFSWYFIKKKPNGKTLFIFILILILFGLIIIASKLMSHEDSNRGIGLIIKRSWEAVITGDYNTLSSGRLSIQFEAIKEVIESPVFGRGFRGFSSQDNLLSSPHNQYLTAVWKMGLLASCFYFYLLFIIAKRMNRSRLLYAYPLNGIYAYTLTVLVIFCSFWDVLMVPNINSFFMFLCGGIYRITDETEQIEDLILSGDTVV